MKLLLKNVLCILLKKKITNKIKLFIKFNSKIKLSKI